MDKPGYTFSCLKWHLVGIYLRQSIKRADFYVTHGTIVLRIGVVDLSEIFQGTTVGASQPLLAHHEPQAFHAPLGSSLDFDGCYLCVNCIEVVNFGCAIFLRASPIV